MKIHLAGVPGAGSMGLCKRERELDTKWKWRLWTYYWLIKNNGKMKRQKNKVDLFLDSGAFSALTQGAKIDINDYINFIKEHEEVIDVYANLDVINSASKTWQNQKIMEEAGLLPLPVFHYGEDVKWLAKYLEHGYEYIALGGLVGGSNSALIRWVDPIWQDYLIDDQGMPKVKVHGFGMTSLKLILRYPWYSVDSTSWVVTGRMGGIMVPRYKNGKWIYDENSWKISVSSRSPGIKNDPDYIHNLSPLKKKLVLSYIHEKGYELGESTFQKIPQNTELKEHQRWAEKKPKDKNDERLVENIKQDGISNRYQLRDEMNIIYYLDLEKHFPEWPWPFKTKIRKKSLL